MILKALARLIYGKAIKLRCDVVVGLSPSQGSDATDYTNEIRQRLPEG